MRHGQRSSSRGWVNQGGAVSWTCLLSCRLSVSDQSVSLDALILQVGSQFPYITKNMRHDQETSISLRHVKADLKPVRERREGPETLL